MDDDIEFIEAPDGQIFMVGDRTAARTLAYITLLEAVRNLKEPELMAEGMEMLKRLRLSIGIHTEVPLGVIKGGKPN
jgi:hypothetical protein